MATEAWRQRARRGSGSLQRRGARNVAQVSLGTGTDGRRIRRTHSFDRRADAQTWIDDQHILARMLVEPIVNDRLDVYLRWWLEHEAPKGKPNGHPLTRSTLATYRNDVERHLIPVLGDRRVGQLTVRELDAFASGKLAEGYAPETVSRIRETLRSALSAAVRQDRLLRNVARYGGGVGAAPPPVDRFTDRELAALLGAAQVTHHFPILLLVARTGLRIGESCRLRWRDLDLGSIPARLTVVWQLDRWGDLVPPKSQSSRRTIPVREEVVSELATWREVQRRLAERQ